MPDDPILELLPRPKTMAEAELMIAVLARLWLGGAEAADVCYRHEVRETSARQIAADTGVSRVEVAKRLALFAALRAEIAAAQEKSRAGGG